LWCAEKISEDKKTSLQNQNRRQNVKERTEEISKTSLVSRANAIISTCIWKNCQQRDFQHSTASSSRQLKLLIWSKNSSIR
jgi:hypothetical protein